MKSRTERKTGIENSLKAPKGQKKIYWRGTHEYLPVIRIQGDMLAYRIDNSRTTRQQQAYIIEHNLKSDFFSDSESLEVQNAQHDILLKMAKSQKGFMEDLKERKQEDELIITRDGYIVNGNRRTSALKDIGESYFNCAVLPEDTNPRDIYSLEQELQISTDFRMEYDWVNELNNIREGLNNPKYGFTEKELLQNLRISSQELKRRLRVIQIVDQFLTWKGDVGNYSNDKLDKTQQAFDDIEKGIKQFANDPYKQILLRNQLFAMIDNKPDEGRIYEPIKKLIRHFDLVQAKLGVNVSVEDGSGNKNVEAGDSDLDLIIGQNGSKEVSFRNSKESEGESSKIFEAIEDAKAEVEDKKDAEAIYISAKSALRQLTNLVVDESTTKKTEAIKTLEALIERSNQLIEELN